MFVDSKAASNPVKRRLRRLTPGERIDEARHFLRLFYAENQLSDTARLQRDRAVTNELRRHGYYEHTRDELAFGARLAWRNHANCVGRLFWKTLEVLDCRHIVEPDDVAGQVFDHMRAAYRDGRIRSIISIFAPVKADAVPVVIESNQIAQFAGYSISDGCILGDPLNVEATRVARSLGWVEPVCKSAFDLLPLVLRDADDGRHLYDIPDGSVVTIPISHPTCSDFAKMNLRWYTVPCVSDMILTIGGIDYPCAPFNGYYLATEIASRDFADEIRYDLLPRVAAVMGFGKEDPLWKDRTLTELNAAVIPRAVRRDTKGRQA